MIDTFDIKIKVPAKTFLLGEYAVLRQKSALVINTTPCFHFRFIKRSGASLMFHPDSIVGKLVEQNATLLSDYMVCTSDPYRSMGGLGLSSAEFIATWMLIEQLLSSDSPMALSYLLEDFKTCASMAKTKASGADVMAQCQDGALSKISLSPLVAEPVTWPFKSKDIVLLHTMKHCSTFKHIDNGVEIPEELIVAAEAGIDAVIASDFKGFVASVKSFVWAQDQAGLLDSRSKAYVDKINEIEGVYVTKGCGAMGCDVIAVVCNLTSTATVVRVGVSLGLLPLECDINAVSGLGASKSYRHFNIGMGGEYDII